MKTSIAFDSNPPGLGELVWRQIATTVAGIRHGMARQRAYRALARLDDRTLQDIGVEREHIWQVVDGVLGREPGSSSTATTTQRDRAIAA